MSYIKFAKNIGLIGFINGLMALKTIILLPILTKSLTVADYGIFSQVMVSLGLAAPLIALGLPYALIRFIASEQDKKEIREGIYSITYVMIAASIALGFIVILFSNFFTHALKIPLPLLEILCITILIECVNLVFFNTLIAFQKIKVYGCFMLFAIIGEISLTWGALAMGFGLFGAVVGFLIIRSLTAISLLTFIIYSHGISMPRFSKIKEYLHFGVPATASNISYWALASSDRYLIGIFLGISYVGYYSPAYSLGNILNFFLFPFLIILPAVLPKSFDSGNLEEVKKQLTYCLKYFLLIAIPAAFGLSILSRQILTVFSTKEISIQAYFVTPFIVASILAYGIYTFFIQIIYLKKKTNILGIIWIIAAAINISLNIIFIPRYGLIAAAIDTLIAYLIALLLAYVKASQYLMFNVDYISIGKMITASIVMAIGILWFHPTSTLQTFIAILMGMIIYGIFIWIFKIFSDSEIQTAKALLRK